VDKGFAESDRVFEDTFTFPMVYHYALEPHVCIAHYEKQGITVWSSAQHPFLVRAELARIFHFPLNQVQVIVPYVGGGFGSKSYTKIEPLVTALSRVTGRPVKLALTVEEAFKTVRRHAAKATVKTGVKRDGTFIARKCLAYVDTGADYEAFDWSHGVFVGASMGSGVVLVLGEGADVVDLLKRITAFFRDESCGQCVPCRVGTVRLEEWVARRAAGGDAPDALLADLGSVLRDASICGLGQTAAMAVESAVRLGLFGGRP
jgi:hypothetical protein